MAMVVQHNLNAMNSNRMLGITTNLQKKSAEKLSSGYKINRAADDAAGLSISEKMRNQIRGLNRASLNAQDGISAVQTAEGALNEAHAILQRIAELAVQGSNDTNMTVDREFITDELQQLYSELDRISSTTQFNKMNLLDGKFSAKKLQVGANVSQFISITIQSCNAKALCLGDKANFKISDYASGNAILSRAQAGIVQLSKQRSLLGSVQNRLEHTIANLDNVAENTQAAESRLRDTDMASEMVEYSKNNILAQAGQSMLAQANTATQGVLTILG